MNKVSIKIFSFFSGVGLLDLGFEKTGYEILEVFEKKEEFLEMYKYSRAKMNMSEPKYGYNLGSVEDYLNNKELDYKVIHERKDGIIGFIGGPPCPDFSIAGKNKGSEGENGKLSSTYFELIKKYKPDFFLFENVKGIWGIKKNRMYIKSKIDELTSTGYKVSFDILNALDFGVPQDRERFIIVGFSEEFVMRNNIDISTVLSALHSDKKIKTSYSWPLTNEFREKSVTKAPSNIEESVTIESWFRKNDVLNHPNANDFFKPKSLEKFEIIAEGDIKNKSFKRLHRWRYSPTAAYGNNEVHLHPYLKRRMSISEVLAIQSAPREFELPHNMTLTNKFKVVGNAVPYLMAKKIAERLKFIIEGE